MSLTPPQNPFRVSFIVSQFVRGSNDICRLEAANQIADNASVTVEKTGVFDLGGFSETIGSLTGFNGPGIPPTNRSQVLLATNAVLTTGGNNASTTYDGNFLGYAG